jgi:hypothetical protein
MDQLLKTSHSNFKCVQPEKADSPYHEHLRAGGWGSTVRERKPSKNVARHVSLCIPGAHERIRESKTCYPRTAVGDELIRPSLRFANAKPFCNNNDNIAHENLVRALSRIGGTWESGVLDLSAAKTLLPAAIRFIRGQVPLLFHDLLSRSRARVALQPDCLPEQKERSISIDASLPPSTLIALHLVTLDNWIGELINITGSFSVT